MTSTYERLARIEAILTVSADDGVVCAALAEAHNILIDESDEHVAANNALVDLSDQRPACEPEAPADMTDQAALDAYKAQLVADHALLCDYARRQQPLFAAISQHTGHIAEALRIIVAHADAQECPKLNSEPCSNV